MPKKPPFRNPIDEEEEYEVGKGRPPKHTRFKPGQSGNPSGRPKGSKKVTRLLAKALEKRITINEGGRKRSVTVKEAMIIRFINKALSGDHKAMMALFAMEAELPEPVLPRSPEREAMLNDPNAVAKVYANFIKVFR